MTFNKTPKIAVIGLGYVGLPLAIALAHHYEVIGFDIDNERIEQLKNGFDRTREIEKAILKVTTLHVTTEATVLKGVDVFIITVPTPVTHDNKPDLTPIENASTLVGKLLAKGAIVVYESTVYPGVTEDFCAPILEKYSSLKSGQDFYLGYSPERINPGDKLHTINRITKVVSGQTPTVRATLQKIYGSINEGNVFVAANIKTAEAAKVIENAQRDINIAFINEVATIVNKLGLSVYDVLEAAKTKWNFLGFQPGLVGGHCIGVDPYYLAQCSRNLGHEPEVILSGRKINESMGAFIANAIEERLKKLSIKNHHAKILVLGLTFKEDIPDLRNTKVIDIVKELQKFGHVIDVHDPFADPLEAKHHLNINLLKNLQECEGYDCIIGAVAHQPYLQLSIKDFLSLLNKKAFVADIKNIWRHLEWPEDIQYWTL